MSDLLKRAIKVCEEVGRRKFYVGIESGQKTKFTEKLQTYSRSVNYGHGNVPSRPFNELANELIVLDFSHFEDTLLKYATNKINKTAFETEIKKWLTLKYKRAIDEGVYRPLAKSTIEARKKRGNASIKPLKDTLKMYKSIGARSE